MKKKKIGKRFLDERLVSFRLAVIFEPLYFCRRSLQLARISRAFVDKLISCAKAVGNGDRGGEDRRKREREIPGTGIKKTVLAAGQEISFSYSSLLPSRGPMPSDDRLIYSWSADLSFFRASWCPYESSIRRQFIFFEIFV